MKINLKGKGKQEGSILILTLLTLVGALSIAMAMASISIVERKMNTKSRKSTVAFQAAGSGIEWALKKINDAEPGKSIKEVFGDGAMDGDGKIDCSGLFSGEDINCGVYFLSGSNENRGIITDENEIVDNVIAVRAAGIFGKEEKVSRHLEAYAFPNCRIGEIRVGDFCIEEKLNSTDEKWDNAAKYCADTGKRLCSAAELVAASDDINSATDADEIGASGSPEWAADVTTAGGITVEGNSGSWNFGGGSGDFEFRCCRNR